MTRLDDFPYQQSFATRWRDNDQYGHVNNVVYYEYFDSTANLFLIEQAGLDTQNGEQIAYVVHSQCQYISPFSYPDRINVGLSVKKLGNSSVTWLLGIFVENDPELKAIGEFVHVFVERKSGQKTALPEPIRHKLATLLVP